MDNIHIQIQITKEHIQAGDATGLGHPISLALRQHFPTATYVFCDLHQAHVVIVATYSTWAFSEALCDFASDWATYHQQGQQVPWSILNQPLTLTLFEQQEISPELALAFTQPPAKAGPELTQPITVHVLSHHIAVGSPRTPSHCAIAWAIRELLPDAKVILVYHDYCELIIRGAQYQYSLPSEASDFITCFDADQPVEPASFTLTPKTPEPRP